MRSRPRKEAADADEEGATDADEEGATDADDERLKHAFRSALQIGANPLAEIQDIVDKTKLPEEELRWVTYLLYREHDELQREDLRRQMAVGDEGAMEHTLDTIDLKLGPSPFDITWKADAEVRRYKEGNRLLLWFTHPEGGSLCYKRAFDVLQKARRALRQVAPGHHEDGALADAALKSLFLDALAAWRATWLLYGRNSTEHGSADFRIMHVARKLGKDKMLCDFAATKGPEGVELVGLWEAAAARLAEAQRWAEEVASLTGRARRQAEEAEEQEDEEKEEDEEEDEQDEEKEEEDEEE